MPNPARPPSSDRCVFFVLPRELRDEIYRLALTSPRNSTLFYRSSVRFYCGTYTAPATSGHKPSFTSAPNSSTRIPFNTLQYVCRQLREETRGLHLILNNLAFTDQNPARINSCRAVDFFHGCSEHILSKICNVEIEEGFPRPARGISSADRRYLLDADWFKRSFVLTSILHIRQVCKSHPKLNVRIRLRKMTLISKAHMDLEDFQDEAFVLGILSGKWIEFPGYVGEERAKAIRNQAAYYRSSWLRPAIGDEDLSLKNFRFFPADAELSDEAAAYMFHYWGTLPEATACMRQWYKSGF